MVSYLCCPICFNDLSNKSQEKLRCGFCCKDYPVVAGIPDLRLFGPLEGSLQTDLSEAQQLDSFGKNKSFEELVLKNSDISKDSGIRSKRLIEFYTKLSLTAEQREINKFKEADYVLKKFGGVSLTMESALDLGTGMGPALPLFAEQFKQVIAVDISLKHLIMARKRCLEKGYYNITYVCACAENLPLKNEMCSFVNSTDVLEHVSDSYLYLKEIHRVLKTGGVFWSSTPNRFTILPEGHIKLWGVGYFPRSLQKKYVHIMRNTRYDGIRPVSYMELSRLMSSVFEIFKIVLPIDMREVIKLHPGISSGLLWKIANVYWNIVCNNNILKPIGYLLEKIFYPQFRMFAVKK